ncbi:hypothetical protein APSETT445_007794 [Aspergillus pseudonomiae]
MSGLITSLLIEPVVRQARRLSQQTEESGPPATQASSIYDRCSSDRGEDDCDNIARGVMSYSEQEIHPSIGAYGENVASEDSPSSVTLWPTGFNDQNHETEISPLSHRTRQITDNNGSGVSDNDAVIMHGIDLTEPRQSTPVAISTQDASQQTSSTLREAQRISHSHLDLVDTGGQSSLPEDDGMGALRKKIHAIRDLNYSSTEQARMIHELMTENYNASRSNLGTSNYNATPARNGILVGFATTRQKTITSIGQKQKTCYACYVGMLNLPRSFVGNAGNNLRSTIATSASSGTTTLAKVSTIAMTAESVESAKD